MSLHLPINVSIPHLDYTVRFRKIVKRKERAAAYTEWKNNWSVSVYLRPNARPEVIGHEIVHVLQCICRDRGINFINEAEHCAYLMGYLMARLYGRKSYLRR